jgi:hypothetical protein
LWHIDVLIARTRRRVQRSAQNHFLHIFGLQFQLPKQVPSVRFAPVPQLPSNPHLGVSARNQHSCSIGRARRNHQRLPSSLLIRNVAAIHTLLTSASQRRDISDQA